LLWTMDVVRHIVASMKRVNPRHPRLKEARAVLDSGYRALSEDSIMREPVPAWICLLLISSASPLSGEEEVAAEGE